MSHATQHKFTWQGQILCVHFTFAVLDVGHTRGTVLLVESTRHISSQQHTLVLISDTVYADMQSMMYEQSLNSSCRDIMVPSYNAYIVTHAVQLQGLQTQLNSRTVYYLRLVEVLVVVAPLSWGSHTVHAEDLHVGGFGQGILQGIQELQLWALLGSRRTAMHMTA